MFSGSERFLYRKKKAQTTAQSAAVLATQLCFSLILASQLSHRAEEMIKLALLLPDKVVWQEVKSPGEFPTDPRSHETTTCACASRVQLLLKRVTTAGLEYHISVSLVIDIYRTTLVIELMCYLHTIMLMFLISFLNV